MAKKCPEVEEYLEAIYRSKENGTPARTSSLAKALGVSPASVSEMLSKLAKKGLIEYAPYKPIKLTKSGEHIGRKITKKHRLIEKFLALLGVRKNLHEEACILEHAVSDNVEKAIERKVNENNLVRICEMKSGECAEVVLISAGGSAKRRLMELGLTPKTKIILKRASNLKGPVEIKVRGSSLALGRGLADKVLVKKLDEIKKA